MGMVVSKENILVLKNYIS